MKVLDEKGKLFGKVNLIDLIVILVLVFVVAGVAWKMAGDQVTEAMERTLPTAEYEVLCEEIAFDVAEYAVTHIGGQLMSNGEMIDGTITDCVIEPRMLTVVADDGTVVYAEDPNLCNVRFTISTKVVLTSNAYAVGTQELRVGKTHIVKTTMLEIAGDITAMEIVDG